MKKNIFLSLSLMSMTIFCADKPIRGESGGTSVPYERPDRSRHGGTPVQSDKPIRGESYGTSVPYAPRGSIAGPAPQQSWFRSFFRPDQRTVRKVITRPESTTIKYVDDDKTLENISPYGTEMTYDPGTLRPQKEVISVKNEMPAARAGETGYISKTMYYPQTGKKITLYGGTNTPKGFITYELPRRNPEPVNTNPGFWSRKWSDFTNWLKAR